jgi:hypothetical protein
MDVTHSIVFDKREQKEGNESLGASGFGIPSDHALYELNPKKL